MNSFVRIDNKGNDILIVGEEPMQELNDIALTAEAKYLINFTQPRKTFCIKSTR